MVYLINIPYMINMYLIVGLGNPEPEYSKTRHNMGFDVINKLSQKYNIEVNKKEFEGLTGTGEVENGKVIFDLPTDELLESYGIIKCSKEDFLRLDEKDYISYKKGKYQYEVLTNNKNNIKIKYNITTIDKPSIEEIMLFYIKGEK